MANSFCAARLRGLVSDTTVRPNFRYPVRSSISRTKPAMLSTTRHGVSDSTDTSWNSVLASSYLPCRYRVRASSSFTRGLPVRFSMSRKIASACARFPACTCCMPSVKARCNASSFACPNAAPEASAAATASRSARRRMARLPLPAVRAGESFHARRRLEGEHAAQLLRRGTVVPARGRAAHGAARIGERSGERVRGRRIDERPAQVQIGRGARRREISRKRGAARRETQRTRAEIRIHREVRGGDRPRSAGAYIKAGELSRKGCAAGSGYALRGSRGAIGSEFDPVRPESVVVPYPEGLIVPAQDAWICDDRDLVRVLIAKWTCRLRTGPPKPVCPNKIDAGLTDRRERSKPRARIGS